jgi:tetratricopeptide (TPR) repeat protein
MFDNYSAAAGMGKGEEGCGPPVIPVIGPASIIPERDTAEFSVAEYREKAHVLRLCGRWSEAVEAARKAISLDPLDPCGRNLLVNILLDRGEYSDVVRESATWLELQPYNTGALEALAKAHWYRSEIDNALRVMSRLLHLSPYEPNYRFQRGVLYQYKGAWGLAMDDFLAVLSGRCAEELRNRTQEAVTSLEHWQLRLIAMLIVESYQFRMEFLIDAEEAVRGRGFRLTEAGIAVLRFLPYGNQFGTDAQSSFYRYE